MKNCVLKFMYDVSIGVISCLVSTGLIYLLKAVFIWYSGGLMPPYFYVCNYVLKCGIGFAPIMVLFRDRCGQPNRLDGSTLSHL